MPEASLSPEDLLDIADPKLLPPPISLPVLGTFDIKSDRVLLTDEDIKIVPDHRIHPERREALEIRKFEQELRERFGREVVFDYWPVRFTRDEDSAVVVVEADQATVFDKAGARRLRAFRNQFYWSRIPEIPIERVRWFAAEKTIVLPLENRIEWRESTATYPLRLSPDIRFRFQSNSFNSIGWKVSRFRHIRPQLSPNTWRDRTIILQHDSMMVSLDRVRRKPPQAFQIHLKCSNFQNLLGDDKSDLGLRVGFSWRIEKGPATNLILPDILEILRWLASWSSSGDDYFLDVFESWVVNLILEKFD